MRKKRPQDRTLYARGIRGIVLPGLYKEASVMKIRWECYTAVCCGIDLFHLPFDTVRPNVFSKMLLAWQRALARGYQRIGVALPYETHNELDIRRESIAAYYENQLPPKRRIPVWQGHFRELESFSRWLKRHEPDCVIGGYPVVQTWLKQQDRRIPQDCGFISLFRDTRAPEITALDSRPHLLGETAMNHLDLLIRQSRLGIPENPLTLMVEPAWHEGSTLPPINPIRRGNDGELVQRE